MENKEMKYEEAISRLEKIVAQIEGNSLDIDQISDSMKEAKQLIAYCREKLFKTEQEINQIMGQEQ